MPFAIVGLPAFLAIYTGIGAALARLLWTPARSAFSRSRRRSR